MALELLFQNGRKAILREEPLKLAADCKECLGNFFAEDALRETAKTCQQLASLDTNILVGYIRRGDLDMKIPDEDEEGMCPICDGELEYGNDISLDEGGVYEWTCPSCGATGKEGYNKVFDQHYDVQDGDGNPFPAPEQ